MFFAGAKDIVGKNEQEFEVETNFSSEQFSDLLLSSYPELKDIWGSCILAVNLKYIDGAPITLKDGDEVAVIPPISGG